MAKINKKRISKKKVAALTIEDQYINKLINKMLKRKQEGYYDKEASIMFYSEADIRDIINIEWKSSVIGYKNFGDKYSKTLKILESSLMGTSAKARGQRNFINGLRNCGALQWIENEIGEPLDPNKLQMVSEATYEYNGEWIISFMGTGGYQQSPTLQQRKVS